MIASLAQRQLEGELMDAPDVDRQTHVTALRGLRRINWVSRTANALWPSLALIGVARSRYWTLPRAVAIALAQALAKDAGLNDATFARHWPSRFLMTWAVCSLHFQHGWDAQKIVANGLFADGAGAAVLGPGDKEADGWHLVVSLPRCWRNTAICHRPPCYLFCIVCASSRQPGLA